MAPLSFVGAGAGSRWALKRTMRTTVAFCFALLFFLYGVLGQPLAPLRFAGAGAGLGLQGVALAAVGVVGVGIFGVGVVVVDVVVDVGVGVGVAGVAGVGVRKRRSLFSRHVIGVMKCWLWRVAPLTLASAWPRLRVSSARWMRIIKGRSACRCVVASIWGR